MKPRRPSSRLPICLFVLAFTLALARSGLAEDLSDTNKWTGHINAGFVLTGGNTDTMLALIGAEAQRLWSMDEFKLGASVAYGRTYDDDDGEKEVTTDTEKGFADYKHLFTDRFYAGVHADALHDGVAEVNYRFTIGPLAGYYFVKNENTRFNAEAGPSLVIEKVRGEPSTQYFTLRFSERWEQKLSETAKFWEQVDYLPQIDDFTDNFLIIAEAGVEVAINSRLALRQVFGWNYDNEPAPHQGAHDVSSRTSLAYKF